MSARPEDVQAAFCATLVDEWARAGVTDAVVSPGSRSTPLTAALAGQDRIRVHVVLDERSAGFMALGIGSASRRPAVVVTTSGTASVELHPAVVEASQAGVPLVAVTTDRPPELHGVGAPQTVEQAGLFAAAVSWSADPGVPDPSGARSWRSLASRAVGEAVAGPGPVHLNLPFREPLVGDASAFGPPAAREGGRPWTAQQAARPAESPVLDGLEGRRGVVVAGEGAALDEREAEAVLEMATRLGWPVLADPRSGLRMPHPLVVSAADAILRSDVREDLRPEVVVRAGASWASKVLGQWLAGLGERVPQIAVDRWGRWADPDRTASRYYRGSLADLAGQVSAGGQVDAWAETWGRAEAAAQAALSQMLGPEGPLAWSEPAVARAAVACMPPAGLLFTSSSMPVRDVEWYGEPRHGLRVLSNRGANGIDGVLSTATGAALGGGAPSLCLIGDLAFLYDVGALLGVNSRDISLSILVLDNDGGGIFSFLPQATAYDGEVFERYWGTPHGVDIAQIAAAYGVQATRLSDRKALDAWLRGSKTRGVRLAVASTDRAANVMAHDRLNEAVAAALRSVS